MIVSTDPIIGDSALLLHFSESRTRSLNSTIVPMFCCCFVTIVCLRQAKSC